ncbi:RNA polymerase factor sigma-32 [bacterium TMED277]|nr:MAG: RNA polymerase factor sigma-32 [bacterium TMED277]
MENGIKSKSSSLTSRAMRAELLEAETELELARNWHYRECEKSLHRLVNAYMRLAISMANKYSRYGVDSTELIQEAGVGLMKAAKKFDPERGVRFSTYATWWIKASIQDFVLRNWSLVRTGSTASQKSLFFNLKRVKSRLEREVDNSGASVDYGSLNSMIAEQMGVPLRDVEMMETRLLGSDFSLNSLQQNEEGREWIETLEDHNSTGAESVDKENDALKVKSWIEEALDTLNSREKRIVVDRKLAEKPRTLDAIGGELGVSKERVRQLETQALKKLKKHLSVHKGIHSMVSI